MIAYQPVYQSVEASAILFVQGTLHQPVVSQASPDKLPVALILFTLLHLCLLSI